MVERQRVRWAALRVVAALILLPSLAGCSVKVHKGENGEDKDVEVRLPVGGVHVRQGPPSAADIGLPTYPGSSTMPDNNHDSADVHVGFGDWQMHLRVAKYQSRDPQTKVTGFYRTALSQYGVVLACRGVEPVGTPTVTEEGLSCREDLGGSHVNDNEGGFNLRAGSKRHQHIVQLRSGDGGGTEFTLLRLDLPGEKEQPDRLQ